jgi:hypothetical protein
MTSSKEETLTFSLFVSHENQPTRLFQDRFFLGRDKKLEDMIPEFSIDIHCIVLGTFEKDILLRSSKKKERCSACVMFIFSCLWFMKMRGPFNLVVLDKLSFRASPSFTWTPFCWMSLTTWSWMNLQLEWYALVQMKPVRQPYLNFHYWWSETRSLFITLRNVVSKSVWFVCGIRFESKWLQYKSSVN